MSVNLSPQGARFGDIRAGIEACIGAPTSSLTAPDVVSSLGVGPSAVDGGATERSPGVVAFRGALGARGHPRRCRDLPQ